jgi:hypothetical protein
VAGLLPNPPDSWTLAAEPIVHDEESLYAYLNGAAPQYLSYGFQTMAHARYSYGGDAMASVTVDVYDMGSELGAYGIFTSGRSRSALPREWGADGYRHGNAAATRKGRYYVHAIADDERSELTETLERLVGETAASIPGETAQPAILSLLPTGGLVSNTDTYVAQDLLGHSFLPGGMMAAYASDAGEGQLFFSDLGGETEAIDALERLREHESRWGEVGEDIASPGDGGFHVLESSLGPGAVIRTRGFVAGVFGGMPLEDQHALLEKLVDKIVRAS